MKGLRSAQLMEPTHDFGRVTLADCEGFRSCTMVQFRRKLREDGWPIFALADESEKRCPIWLLLVHAVDGEVWRVATRAHPITRRLSSVQRVYQICRDAGITRLSIPIDQDHALVLEPYASKKVDGGAPSAPLSSQTLR